MALDVATKPHQLIASDRIEGTAVRRPNGSMIGHIERLMIDKVSGKVSYAVLSFGGFLGMGTNLLPLPWGRLRYNTRFEAYELDVDNEELKRAPSFRADKDFDWGDRSQEAELHRYYGMPPYWGGFSIVFAKWFPGRLKKSAGISTDPCTGMFHVRNTGTLLHVAGCPCIYF